jgi:light-regulated signal transduction histidine kinase (bacteriophytochrome)
MDTKHQEKALSLEKVIVHDLINAAGSLPMLVDLLAQSTSREEQSEYVDLLQVSVERLLSKLYHEKMILESSDETVCQVADVVKNLQEYYRNHPLTRHCRIEIAEALAHGTTLVKDQQLLMRVLDKMVRNAIEGTQKGGIVTLGCRRNHDEIEFWVHTEAMKPEDVGTGILPGSPSAREPHQSVGTQTIRRLSELCGGRVSVSIGPDGANTVSVRFPAFEFSPQAVLKTTYPSRKKASAV